MPNATRFFLKLVELTYVENLVVSLVYENGTYYARFDDEVVQFGRDGDSEEALIESLMGQFDVAVDEVTAENNAAREILVEILRQLPKVNAVSFLTDCKLFLARVDWHIEELVAQTDESFAQVLDNLHRLFVMAENDVGELAFAG